MIFLKYSLSYLMFGMQNEKRKQKLNEVKFSPAQIQ